MFRSIFCVCFSFFLFCLSPLHASHDLIECYDFGLHQTGIAFIDSKHREENNVIKDFSGTVNLIEVESQRLQGRLMMTTAEIAENLITDDSTVRFISDRNNFYHSNIQETYIHPDYTDSSNFNVALLLLDEAVDTERFTPLPLDFTPLVPGQEFSIYGCGSYFGKTASQEWFFEAKNHSLRQGCKIILGEDAKSKKPSSETITAHNIFRLNGERIRFASINPKTVTWGNFTQFYSTTDIDTPEGSTLPKNLDFALLKKEWDIFSEHPTTHPYQADLDKYTATFYPKFLDPSETKFYGHQGGAVLSSESGGIIALNNQSSLLGLKNEEDFTSLSSCRDWIEETIQRIAGEI